MRTYYRDTLALRRTRQNRLASHAIHTLSCQTWKVPFFRTYCSCARTQHQTQHQREDSWKAYMSNSSIQDFSGVAVHDGRKGWNRGDRRSRSWRQGRFRRRPRARSFARKAAGRCLGFTGIVGDSIGGLLIRPPSCLPNKRGVALSDLSARSNLNFAGSIINGTPVNTIRRTVRKEVGTEVDAGALTKTAASDVSMALSFRFLVFSRHISDVRNFDVYSQELGRETSRARPTAPFGQRSSFFFFGSTGDVYRTQRLRFTAFV